MSTPNGVFIRLDPDQINRLDDLADRMGITRTDLARKAVLNGLDDLGQAVSLAEWPLIRAAVKVVSRLSDDPAAVDEVDQILDAIKNHKRMRRQNTLPGMEPA